MGKQPVLRFFDNKLLGYPKSLENTIELILSMNFKISNITVGTWTTEIHAHWSEFDKSVLSDFPMIAYKYGHLKFLASGTQINEQAYLTMWFDMKWDWSENSQPINQRFYAYSGDSQLFIRREFDREFYAQLVMNIGLELYPILQPQFGWIERVSFMGDNPGYTKEQDVKALTIPHIYWANFFGSAYIKKLGLKFLHNAPGWRKDILDDGGFLYVLSPTLAGTGRDKLGEAVKLYFGIAHVRQRLKKKK